MIVKAAYVFFLGKLDAQVATGTTPLGTGTRDIRCGFKDKDFREFFGFHSIVGNRKMVDLESVPELSLPAYSMPLVIYGGSRNHECAFPGQHKGSRHPYPLWAMCVRVLRTNIPKDLVLFLKDSENKFNLRIIRKEKIRFLPKIVRESAESSGETGILLKLRGMEFSSEMVFRGSRFDEELYFGKVRTLSERVLVLKKLGAHGFGNVSKKIQEKRSRALVQELKNIYNYTCQLCGSKEERRIPMLSGRYYVEVHHLRNLAETISLKNLDQDKNVFKLDSSDNAIVVCPYHHRLIHFHYAAPLLANKNFRGLVSKSGVFSIPIRLNRHLGHVCWGAM